MSITLRSIASTAIAGVLAAVTGGQAFGQTAEFPPCPPPAANEYLLLVRGETAAERTRIQELLPASSTVLVCNYLDDTVVRGGGFTDLETANAWAQYMTEVEQLQAFVARPAVAAPATATQQPAPSTEGAGVAASPGPSQVASPAFDPRSLGTGYAVLVDYQNQPEVALSVQERVGQAVGLAVYRQRPYLLIAHSPEVGGAATTLQVLADRNISSFIANSQEVVMLTPAIATAL